MVFDPFAGGELERTAPTTEAQKEIWTSALLGPEASCAFNESFTLDLRGPLDAGALGEALHRLARRHEALRTTFSPDGEMLCVMAEPDVPMTVEDLADRPGEESAARVREVEEEQVLEPFDLGRGPLLRTVLVRRSADFHSLVVTAHHIVCDGWSTGILVRELGPLYADVLGRTGAEALTGAPRYSDYAAATSTSEADLQYWQRQFEGSVPVLDLPTDAARPDHRSFRSRRVDHVLDRDLVQALKRMAGQERASLFALLLAGFTAWLHRLTGEEDLVVGVPAAGQANEAWGRLVGHCVHLLPMRFVMDGHGTFRNHLLRTRGIVLDSFEHATCTLSGLLRALRVPRDPSRVPLASVMFNLDRSFDNLVFADLGASFRSNPRRFENFEIFLNAVERDGELVLECQYNEHLFEEATVRQRLRGYEALLRRCVEGAGFPLRELPVMSPAEEERVLRTWNRTDMPYRREATIHALVADQASRTPDRVAVVADDVELTYADVMRRAGGLARVLRDELGVAPGTLVGLALPRGADLIVASLAVLEAGAAYVPLDPAYPEDRLRFMLEDAGIRVLLSRGAVADGLPRVEQCRTVLLDELEAAMAAGPGGANFAPVDPESPAYVIYTSGSTGRPKGVRVPHRAMVNFLTTMAREPGMAADDVLLAITTFSFDIAGLELFLPLTVGARCVVAPEGAGGDPAALMELLDRHAVTVLQATPSTWRVLVEGGWHGGPGFRALSGGEALPRDLALELVSRAGAVWNLYGPTETTVWSTAHRLTSGLKGAPPIGRPIGNTRVYVLDPEGRPVPPGVSGELLIGGDGVALGYLDRPELTAERFVPDRFAGDGTGRLYRTGDLVRHDHDGLLHFERRLDSQVKIRGFRVELGEVEENLRAHPAVADAAAVVQRLGAGDERLVAWYVVAPGRSVEPSELRDALGTRLPSYMVPQLITPLDELPRTLNGKLDRAVLERMEVARPAFNGVRAEPRTDVERVLAAVWADILGTDDIGLDDDFFMLGGHSILATRIIPRVEDSLGVRLSLQRLFSSPVLRDLAGHVETLLAVRSGVTADATVGDDREEFAF